MWKVCEWLPTRGVSLTQVWEYHHTALFIQASLEAHALSEEGWQTSAIHKNLSSWHSSPRGLKPEMPPMRVLSGPYIPPSITLSSFPHHFCPVFHPPCGSAGKESACKAGDLDSIPGWGRSPREGNGYPLQYSGLENPMDCKVHRVIKGRTWLSDFHFDAPLLWSRLPCSVWTVGLRKEWWKLGRVTEWTLNSSVRGLILFYSRSQETITCGPNLTHHLWFFGVLVFFFKPHCRASGILASHPGIRPMPTVVEVWSPNHWIARGFSTISFYKVLLEHSQTHLFTLCFHGYFCATMAELSSWDRNLWLPKTKIFTIWTLTEIFVKL